MSLPPSTAFVVVEDTTDPPSTAPSAPPRADTANPARSREDAFDGAGPWVRVTAFDAAGERVGEVVTVERAGLAAVVAAVEAAHHPRWVWDDTARWYPPLLAAGVRVERCHDLRLAHAILRTSVLTAASALATAPPSAWDTMAAAPLHAPGAPDAAAASGGAPHLRPADPTQTTLFDSETFAPAEAPRDKSRMHLPTPTEGAFVTSRHGDGPVDAEAEWHAQRDAIRHAGGEGTERGGGGDDAGRRVGLLVAAESAGALAAAEMGWAGLPYSAAVHDEVLTELLGPRPQRPPGARPGDPDPRPARLEALLHEIRAQLGDPAANPDSPVELLKSLRRAGLNVTSTRSWELQNIDHPAIPPLLDYKKRARILTANGWHWSDTWVRGPEGRSRFHPTYLPGGVVTGRWASEGGGALQLPKAVRRAVRADPGHLLVVADAAQLEPRILTALAGDRAMAAAGRGRDLYDGIVASGAVDTRAHAKVGMLGAMYGGTTGESGRMLPRLARAYPAAIAFVEAAARTGEAGGVVSTRLGRTSPRPGDDWLDLRDAAAADGATDAQRSRARGAARSWGRFTRNFVVQGTAAEWALCWISSLRRRLWALGEPDVRLEHRPHLAFFLHDELMVHTPAEHADAVAAALRESAAEAGRLLFGDAPVEFPVTVAVVDSYDQAK